MARNQNIYGADDTSMAESIASDALGSTKGTEDIWGTAMDARAESYDGTKDPQPGDTEIITKLKAGSGDDGNMDSDFSRNSPRHRKVAIKGDESTFTPPDRFSGK